MNRRGHSSGHRHGLAWHRVGVSAHDFPAAALENLPLPVLCVPRGVRGFSLYVQADIARAMHVLREDALRTVKAARGSATYTRQPVPFYIRAVAALFAAGVKPEVLFYAASVPGAVSAIWRAKDPDSWRDPRCTLPVAARGGPFRRPEPGGTTPRRPRRPQGPPVASQARHARGKEDPPMTAHAHHDPGGDVPATGATNTPSRPSVDAALLRATADGVAMNDAPDALRLACSTIALAELNALFTNSELIAHPEAQKLLDGCALYTVGGRSTPFAIRTDTNLAVDVYTTVGSMRVSPCRTAPLLRIVRALRDCAIFAELSELEALTDTRAVRALHLALLCVTSPGWSCDALELLADTQKRPTGVPSALTALWDAHPELTILSVRQAEAMLHPYPRKDVDWRCAPAD